MTKNDTPREEQEHAPPETPETEEATPEEKTDAERAAEYLEGWKRSQADYQNLQKDTQQRLQHINKFATEQFLQELLPMVDHFKYALAGIPPEDRDNAWAKGIEYIQQNFMNILKAHGAEPIAAVGKPFDATMHEALEEVDGDGTQDSGTVAEEVSTGFTLNGKVIQVARVKVVK